MVRLKAGGLVLPKEKEKEKKRRKLTADEIRSIDSNIIFGPPPTNPFAPTPELLAQRAPTSPNVNQPLETFKSAETGTPSGAAFGGKTFLGLSGSDIALLKQQQGVTDAAPIGTDAARRALSEDLGKIVLTGDPVKDRLSYEQAFKSALAGTATNPATITGLATAGASLATGIGVSLSPYIAGAGVIAGFVSEFKNNIKTQRVDIIKGEQQNLMKTEQNMLKQVMLMNQLPRLGGTTDDMIQIKTFFDEQMAFTDENHRKLNAESTDKLSLWLGEDGHKQLEKYSTFNSPGGMREILIKQMTLAINSPDLGRIPGLQSQVQTLQGEIEAEQ